MDNDSPQNSITLSITEGASFVQGQRELTNDDESDLGSSDGSFDGSSNGNLDGSLLGDSLEYKFGPELGSS